jgi:hypothetical protein
MEKEFVPYELALKLKGLKFNEFCFGIYKKQQLNFLNDYKEDKHVLAPTYGQAFRFFRDAFRIHHLVKFSRRNGIGIYYYFEIDIFETGVFISQDEYNSYEKAETESLKKMIEIIEQNINLSKVDKTIDNTKI